MADPKKDTSGGYICTACGFVGRPKKITKGSFAIEVVLWLFFILPGLIYSIWRLTSRHSACPKCFSQTMIPVNTPVGQKLLLEQKSRNSEAK